MAERLSVIGAVRVCGGSGTHTDVAEVVNIEQIPAPDCAINRPWVRLRFSRNTPTRQFSRPDLPNQIASSSRWSSYRDSGAWPRGRLFIRHDPKHRFRRRAVNRKYPLPRPARRINVKV